MYSEKRFKTKTGYCHILADKIILTRDGIVGNAAKITVGTNIGRILVIYGLIVLGLIYFAIKNFNNKDNFTALLFMLIAIYLIYGIFDSLNNSATQVIDRKSIQKVKFIKGMT